MARPTQPPSASARVSADVRRAACAVGLAAQLVDARVASHVGASTRAPEHRRRAAAVWWWPVSRMSQAAGCAPGPRPANGLAWGHGWRGAAAREPNWRLQRARQANWWLTDVVSSRLMTLRRLGSTRLARATRHRQTNLRALAKQLDGLSRIDSRLNSAPAGQTRLEIHGFAPRARWGATFWARARAHGSLATGARPPSQDSGWRRAA